jgi:hypothetical protein
MANELLTPQVDGSITRQYEKMWDFTDQPDSSTLLLWPVTGGAAANSDISATLCGTIPGASRLLAGYITASINSTGIAAGDTSVAVVAVGGTTVLSLTRTTNYVANTPVDLGTPVVTDLAAGTAVTLAITNGTNANQAAAICCVALDVCDSSAFPAMGLKLIASDGGTATISDGVKGILTLTTGAADNSEIYLCTSTELFKMAANKHMKGGAYVQFTNTNTADNLFFGFMSTVAANSMVDTSGGPQATGDYIGLWSLDGIANFYAGVQSNGTATPTTDAIVSPTTTAGGASYMLLEVEWHGLSSTEGQATFRVDGVVVADIHHTYASATEMALMVGLKTGEAVTHTLNVDYLGYAQLR